MKNWKQKLIALIIGITIWFVVSNIAEAKQVVKPRNSFDYGITKDDLDKQLPRINKRIGIKATDNTMTKVNKIYNFVKNNTWYRYGCDMRGVFKDLADGKGVSANCNAQSQIFYTICAYNHIPVRMRIGNVGYTKGYHQWCIVKIGKKWYWVDTTWSRKPFRKLDKVHMRRKGKQYGEYWGYIDCNGIMYWTGIANRNQKVYNNLSTNIVIKGGAIELYNYYKGKK